MMNFNKYQEFLNCGKHEILAFDYIIEKALDKGYELYCNCKDYKPGDKLIFAFKKKLIALVELGDDLEEGSNMIISHIDSPRLDVIPNDPFVKEDDGVFWKTVPYGGIVAQLWLDRPLVLVGRAMNNKGETVNINTEDIGVSFTITSLLPHLGGRKETDELKCEKLLVRMGDNILEGLKDKYGLTEDNLKFADLSFVPYGNAYELGFNKEFIASYGHDDRVCAYAELEALFNSNASNKTKIALFTSYEETGSGQSTGAESQYIDDIFIELLDSEKIARRAIRNSKMISADVCAGYDSNYASHFEKNCKPICGQGVGIVPFLGNKRGNDATIVMREHVRKLCEDNNIAYQLETTKLGEGGGGTVSTFFCIKGVEVIDCGVPVLAMHSPQELIHKNDLQAAYDLYKVFFESD